MADLYNWASNLEVGFGANNRITKPSTRFGTRQLAFYDVQITGVASSPYAANSLFAKAIRGVQTQAEIYAVGEPSSDHFIVVLSQDTTNDGGNTESNELGSNLSNGMAQNLATAIGAAIDGSATVTAKHLHGAGFGSGLMDYNDESQGI
jgi:hypothetical protein